MSDKTEQINDSNKKDNRRNDNQGKNSGDNKNQGYDKKRIYLRRKICRFCADKSLEIDYKRYDILRKFTTEGGKIIPRRMSGNCAKHQRMLAKAVKIARYMAILPYVKQ